MFITVSEAQVDEALVKLTEATEAKPETKVDVSPTATPEPAERIETKTPPGAREAEPPADESDLARAWKILNEKPTDLLPLVQEVLGDEWDLGESANRLQGPCPSGKGKCTDDPRSAYIYPRDDGGPPFLYCHHENSCGNEQSVFDLVADHLGSRPEAARRIKDAAGVLDAEIDGDVKPTSERTTRENVAFKLVKLVLEDTTTELWSPPGEDTDGYISLAVNGHMENMKIRSSKMEKLLRRLCLRQLGKAANNTMIADALNVLDAEATDGKKYPTFQRVGSHEGDFYLDLCTPDWNAVRITKDGWDIVKQPPVKFIRSGGMKPLPTPVRGGSLSELRRFVNVANDDDFLLVLSWVLAALRPRGPYPVLCVHGEQGSAKSTLVKILRDLVDPNVSPRRSAPREERDLMVMAKRAQVCSFDQLSSLSDWLSDALCRLANGGGFSTRALYSDDDEVVFDVQRPVILAGIPDLATRSDLLNRSIILRLTSIPTEKRLAEERFFAEFDGARPRILGALLDAIVTGLKRLPDVKLEGTPRMADFTLWVAAVEPALGCASGQAVAAYLNNCRVANEAALEADPIFEPLREVVAGSGGTWQGTATDLLHELREYSDEETRRQKGWPKQPQTLSGHLRRLAPNLRTIGIDYYSQRITVKPGERAQIHYLNAQSAKPTPGDSEKKAA